MTNTSHFPIHVTRSGYMESTHTFHAAVVDQYGKLVYYYGNPKRPTFARSSMKPFQAVSIIETGAAAKFNYGPEELAISCASHSGESIHRQTVLNILERIGLPEESLQCGMHPPKNDEDYRNLIRSGQDLSPVFSNCSGKHSGMLATAVHLDEAPETYREVSHPVQQRILKAISELCDTPLEEIEMGVDGCGAPVHRLPLEKVAFGYAQLAAGQSERHPEHDQALKQLRNAMIAHPHLVGGEARFDTDVMTLFSGNVVAKAGAEGVQCFGIVDKGIGIAIKIEDGNPRPLSAIALKIMEDLGVVPKEISETDLYKEYRIPPVLNMRKERIGNIEVSFTLNS